MAKVLFVGDTHLGGVDKYFSHVEKPNKLVFKTLRMAIPILKDKGIKRMVFVGDIFNEPSPPQWLIIMWLLYLVELLEEIPDLTIEVIMGNHDWESINKTSFIILQFIKKIGKMDRIRFHTEPFSTVIDGVPFQFLPWPIHKRIKDTPPSVIVAHITINGTVMNSGYKAKNKIEVDPGKDVWLVGDIHKRHTPKPRFHYVGTPYQTRADEELPKGFTILEARKHKKKGIKYSLEFCPIEPAFKIESLTIKSKDDFDKLTDDPTISYKLFISEGIKQPTDLRTRFPNIWKIEGYKTKEDLQSKSEQSAKWLEKFLGEQQGKSSQRITHGLKGYLVSNGMKKKQARIALRYMKREIEPSLK